MNSHMSHHRLIGREHKFNTIHNDPVLSRLLTNGAISIGIVMSDLGIGVLFQVHGLMHSLLLLWVDLTAFMLLLSHPVGTHTGHTSTAQSDIAKNVR